MHNWGDKDSQGRDICSRVDDAAQYIANFIITYGRIPVTCAKEKFGAVRVYCYMHTEWWLLDKIGHMLNKILEPYRVFIYRLAYKKAIKKWPDIQEEILCCADFYKLLDGIAKNDELDNWPWPYLRVNFGGDKEYMCPHGVGHGGAHCCDGCCSHPSFNRRVEENKNGSN